MTTDGDDDGGRGLDAATRTAILHQTTCCLGPVLARVGGAAIVAHLGRPLNEGPFGTEIEVLRAEVMARLQLPFEPAVARALDAAFLLSIHFLILTAVERGDFRPTTVLGDQVLAVSMRLHRPTTYSDAAALAADWFIGDELYQVRCQLRALSHHLLHQRNGHGGTPETQC